MHCKMKGHEIGNCFKLYGYPEWWADRNQGGKNQQPNRGLSSASHVLPRGRKTAHDDAKAKEDVLTQLKPEQVKALINMLNTGATSVACMSGPTLGEPDWSR
ncbi:unnamed protein product [Cuscuta europaea]|uniref:Gag protein n=1 Tax=Cuscuta europaea TaxID=41803 RepID=A0A9P0ZCD2_CUSEU|nr:unnamed protein product [Cuscuta europaea]